MVYMALIRTNSALPVSVFCLRCCSWCVEIIRTGSVCGDVFRIQDVNWLLKPFLTE